MGRLAWCLHGWQQQQLWRCCATRRVTVLIPASVGNKYVSITMEWTDWRVHARGTGRGMSQQQPVQPVHALSANTAPKHTQNNCEVGPMNTLRCRAWPYCYPYVGQSAILTTPAFGRLSFLQESRTQQRKHFKAYITVHTASLLQAAVSELCGDLRRNAQSCAGAVVCGERAMEVSLALERACYFPGDTLKCLVKARTLPQH